MFRSRGLAQTFAEDVMRADLTAGPPPVALQDDLVLSGWFGNQPRFFTVYASAFADRPGFPGWSQDEWTQWIGGDDEFAPRWTFLASREGAAVGFVAGALGEAGTGWIVQVGVRPEFRRQGLGAALTAEAMRRMRADGVAAALLDVNTNNPGAARTYARLGFERIGRRARYER